MAANPGEQAPDREEGGGLSVAAARFYAQVYEPARAGCTNELRKAGCSEEEAEDLFMTTFERVMRTVDPIARDFAAAQMVNLLKIACRRRLIDERRHQALVRQVELGEVGPLADTNAEGPEEVVEEREEVAIGREALLSLSERDRLVFRQRHQLNLSPKEIQRNVPGLSSRSYRKIIERANVRVLEAFEQIESGERCQEMEAELLRRHIAGSSSAQESQLVEAHLEHCRPCQQANLRMRGYLHDVASGLAVGTGVGHTGVFAHGLARLAGALSHGGDAVLVATRALRERSRDALLRVPGALPGSGGDATFGQAFGVSGVKIASVCAAGAAAATCLAAGIVPGVGGIGLLNHPEHHAAHHTARHVARSAPSVVQRVTEPAAAGAGASTANPMSSGGAHAAKRRASETGSSSSTAAASSASAQASSQRKPEFGVEAGGTPIQTTQAPAPTAPSSSSTNPSAGGGSSSHSGGGGSTRKGSSSEFGL